MKKIVECNTCVPSGSVSKMQNKITLTALPYELIALIFEHLGAKDRARIAVTCSSLKNILMSSDVKFPLVRYSGEIFDNILLTKDDIKRLATVGVISTREIREFNSKDAVKSIEAILGPNFDIYDCTLEVSNAEEQYDEIETYLNVVQFESLIERDFLYSAKILALLIQNVDVPNTDMEKWIRKFIVIFDLHIKYFQSQLCPFDSFLKFHDLFRFYHTIEKMAFDLCNDKKIHLDRYKEVYEIVSYKKNFSSLFSIIFTCRLLAKAERIKDSEFLTYIHFLESLQSMLVTRISIIKERVELPIGIYTKSLRYLDLQFITETISFYNELSTHTNSLNYVWENAMFKIKNGAKGVYGLKGQFLTNELIKSIEFLVPYISIDEVPFHMISRPLSMLIDLINTKFITPPNKDPETYRMFNFIFESLKTSQQ